MAAGKYDLVIDQGSDFAIQLTMKNGGVATDLTGYDARAQLRANKKPSTAVSATFTCTVTDAVNGIVKMELTNEDTAALAAGVYYYDLEVFIPGTPETNVTRLLQGKAVVDANVTR